MAQTGKPVRLLNFGNLPVDSLNGLTSAEVDLVAELSKNDCRVDELVTDFLSFIERNMGEEETNTTLPPEFQEQLKELDEAEIASLPASSRRQMEEHGRNFLDFLKSRGLTTDLVGLDDDNLNQYLRLYYFQLKTKDGRSYSPSSLVCIRAGIQRFLNLVIKRRTNLIASGTPFDGSNRMLQLKVREFIQSGRATQSYEPIEEGDIVKLRHFFDRSDAERLQDETLFSLLYQLGERGQEHLKCFLTKKPLVRGTDADGRSFACLPSLPSKNRRAELDSLAASDQKHARVYDTSLLDLYEASIPDSSESFLPRPMKSTSENKYNFSVKQNRGYRYLQDFMRNLSEKAELSKKYTNHCIRVTRICDLESSGSTVHDIMMVTGHKSESTVRRYLHTRRDRSLYQSSRIVQAAMTREVTTVSHASGAAGTSAAESEQLRVVSNPEKRMRIHVDGTANVIDFFFE